MQDFQPFYKELQNDRGVSASLLPDGSGAETVTISVIDLTKGVEIPQADGIQLQTIKPVARARMGEITEVGLTRDDLDDAEITFNDKTWRISAHRLRPGPEGELRGEVDLLLTEPDESA